MLNNNNSGKYVINGEGIDPEDEVKLSLKPSSHPSELLGTDFTDTPRPTGKTKSKHIWLKVIPAVVIVLVVLGLFIGVGYSICCTGTGSRSPEETTTLKTIPRTDQPKSSTETSMMTVPSSSDVTTTVTTNLSTKPTTVISVTSINESTVTDNMYTDLFNTTATNTSPTYTTTLNSIINTTTDFNKSTAFTQSPEINNTYTQPDILNTTLNYTTAYSVSDNLPSDITTSIDTLITDKTTISTIEKNETETLTTDITTPYILEQNETTTNTFIISSSSHRSSTGDDTTVTEPPVLMTTQFPGDRWPITYGMNLESSTLHKNGSFREGQATDTNSCDNVTAVPDYLRDPSVIWSEGIPQFYQKYTEVYGIPIVGSNNVTDAGLRRACYVIRYMLASRYDIRNAIYKFYARVAIIGDGEQQTDIWEHRNLGKEWNTRARGLGATLNIPLTSVGDDNLRCNRRDRYPKEDILVHEFCHAIHVLGAEWVIPGFQARLMQLYNTAIEQGKYNNQYMITTDREYFAQGAEIYLGLFSVATQTPDGTAVTLSDRNTLSQYDEGLASLLQEIFPCENTFIDRCDWKNESQCNLGNYKKIYDSSEGWISNCPVRDTTIGATVEECAVKACTEEVPVFIYTHPVCHVLDCAGTSRQDLKLEKTGYFDVYVMDKPVVMDTQFENNQVLTELCTKGVNVPGSCNISESNRVQCGPTRQTAQQCHARGCCYHNNKCYYSKLTEECLDTEPWCPASAGRGECSTDPGRMHRKCKMSCDLCMTGSPYRQDILSIMCQDQLSNCYKKVSDGKCMTDKVNMKVKCPLSCRLCSSSKDKDTTTVEMTTTKLTTTKLTTTEEMTTAEGQMSTTIYIDPAWPTTMGSNLDNFDHPHGHMREGQATDSHSCHYVRQVPEELRNSSVMYPGGIPLFYQKYTEAYGIPIIGSENVTDGGLMRACYTARFMMSSRYDVRNALYKFYIRISLIGDREDTTSLWEYRTWDSEYWDKRTRGIGPTMHIPMASVGDDNQRCKPVERYPNNDIMVHEFAHAVDQYGARYVIPGFMERLVASYNLAVEEGRYKDTYMGSNFNEYWAVGTEIFFETYRHTGYKYTINGSSTALRDRHTLRMYDPDLVDLLEEVYPCPNKLIYKCEYKTPPNCGMKNFKLLYPKSLKQQLICGTDRTYIVPTPEQCAIHACERSRTVFSFIRGTCKVTRCDPNNLRLKSTRPGVDIYTIVTKPRAGQIELNATIHQMCNRPVDYTDLCDVTFNDQCGPSDGTSGQCYRRGCCMSNGRCIYSKSSVCVDKTQHCADQSVKGYCTNRSYKSYMRSKCPVSCDNGVCNRYRSRG